MTEQAAAVPRPGDVERRRDDVPPPTTPPGRQARGIARSIGAGRARRAAARTLRRGEVMALMGDNGAGKSTLVKTLAGVVTPDRGEILVDGAPRRFAGPADALDAGIETVYQDLSLIDSMSAAENVFLGREPLGRGPMSRLLRLVDRRAMAERTQKAVDRIGARLPSLSSHVSSMSGGQRQALAVARATMWGRNIVMLDEPTAALGVTESGHVLEIITALKQQDIAVLMISHNLEHVFRVADRVTVMRQGRTVGELTTAEASSGDIVALITGAASAAPVTES